MTTPLVGDIRSSLGIRSDFEAGSREESRANYPEEMSPEPPRLSVEEDFGIDIDLSPQLNLALREEVRYDCTPSRYQQVLYFLL